MRNKPLIRIVSSIRFSRASREAFAHALKIARQAKAELEMVPVERPNRDSELERFPRVRPLLARGRVLPLTSTREDVALTVIIAPREARSAYILSLLRGRVLLCARIK